MRQHKNLALVLLASILLGFGLFLPCLIVTPAAGKWTGVLRIFSPDLAQPRPVSIVEGIQRLIETGHFFVAVIILTFSIIFPLWKLGVLWAAAWASEHGERPVRLLRIVANLGKYSMIDVLVVALLVVVIKGLPGGSKVELGAGFYTFSMSVLLALGMPVILRRNWRKGYGGSANSSEG